MRAIFAITTIVDCGKLVTRVTVEGAAQDLYEGSQLPKVYKVARA